MSFFQRLRRYHPDSQSPPEWTHSDQLSHDGGRFSDATENEYEQAERFCELNPVENAKLLASNVINEIREKGSFCWSMERPQTSRFQGEISLNHRGVTLVETRRDCGDCSMLSTLPIMAGEYYRGAPQKGVYFEVKIIYMGLFEHGDWLPGIIAIGTACKPYPVWRFPGWNRLSAGWHLDDMRKFFENPNGGQDYPSPLGEVNKGSPEQDGMPRDVIGCGINFVRAFNTQEPTSYEIFYTHNGTLLAPPAFSGVYSSPLDVYAAVGVEGPNKFEVNFGAEPFVWEPANSAEWSVRNHVGVLNNASVYGPQEDGLPSYAEARLAPRP